MTKGTVLCSSKKQRRRPEPRGARLCSQNPKQQISCSPTEARKNGFRLSGSLCACSKQRLNNERLGTQNHHQTDVPKSKAGSRICETGQSKTETRHGKSGAGGRIETTGTSCETGHTKIETRQRRRFRKKEKSKNRRHGLSKRSRSSHGAPAGESCRKKNKRRRRAVDRTLTHEEDTRGGEIRDENRKKNREQRHLAPSANQTKTETQHDEKNAHGGAHGGD
jgi:hypothetical protein